MITHALKHSVPIVNTLIRPAGATRLFPALKYVNFSMYVDPSTAGGSPAYLKRDVGESTMNLSWMLDIPNAEHGGYKIKSIDMYCRVGTTALESTPVMKLTTGQFISDTSLDTSGTNSTLSVKTQTHNFVSTASSRDTKYTMTVTTPAWEKSAAAYANAAFRSELHASFAMDSTTALRLYAIFVNYDINL
jgi:hypothetical protein